MRVKSRNNNSISKGATVTYYKRGTKAEFEASDYVPRTNEILIAEDAGISKNGDGIHTWKDLPESNDNEE